ncbi:zinc finger protein 664-like [Hemicordylus capensis]|uniref:zinc finger protein 664-like n=1 Tax=Hemicordylus capensis TaxID=884348 RepID=UPI002304971E|nr:zinc finger protein 664-like [Hemicordylus capensis]XP_053102998.1 zinc finger protein 664-like [Hemicordylus capensis]XP_053102999.1 zinc finger protein 664-like [Hemicordylus capensis]XP_053103000.1 zinc finger protein 664-like [Hemicordylus capensis]
MDVEVNWESDYDTQEDHSEDSSCTSEWVSQKASLQLEAEEDYSQPSSPSSSPAGPSGWQELPVELHCEEEETRNISHQWSDSTTAGIFITSSTNFDLQCEDEGLGFGSLEHAKGTWGRISEDHKDIIITDSFGEEDFTPTSGNVLSCHCKRCGETCHNLSTLQKHQQYHASEHLYQCPICSKEFFRVANFRMHKLIHSSDRPYKCSECDKGFIHKVDLLRHMQNVHKIEYLKTLRCASSLKGSSVHQNQNAASQVCPGETCREQPKTCRCSTCGKGFRTADLLSKHKMNHQQDKPYECQECGKAFAQLLRLKRHQKIHTGECPFYCQECGGAFTRRSSLHRHQRIHSGEKPYSCIYCGQDFIESGSLRKHERIHQEQT